MKISRSTFFKISQQYVACDRKYLYIPEHSIMFIAVKESFFLDCLTLAEWTDSLSQNMLTTNACCITSQKCEVLIPSIIWKSVPTAWMTHIGVQFCHSPLLLLQQSAFASLPLENTVPPSHTVTYMK